MGERQPFRLQSFESAPVLAKGCFPAMNPAAEIRLRVEAV